ncbi:hypothetical protein MPSEU_000215800 [Mayamaea pseudoterrestris]|nr:hypothetical protein MPSEU_000215800 [Mayamaea pseudoterrestris]
MGNSPSTARQIIPVESNDQAFWDSSPILQQFRVQTQFGSGSGRMMRTVSLRHSQKQSTCVGKLMYIPVSIDTTQQEAEIKRLQELKKSMNLQSNNVAVWSVLSGNSLRIQNQWYKPVALLRPYLYTTLRDRLASRPFLDSIEQVWIAAQLLSALDHLHRNAIVHGFVSTSNVGLTSSGWVVLLDISSVYKPFVSLPDDDPSDYLLAFHSERCYLAPERFCKSSMVQSANKNVSVNANNMGIDSVSSELTPAMDIFAAGCVLVELFLNGERCMDLGDLMEYRRGNSSSVQQTLAKVEHAAIRAACKHMLSLDPRERLSAREYLDRLEAQEDTVPKSLKLLTDLVGRATSALIPDARIALAAQEFGRVVFECVGVHDAEGTQHCNRMLGPDMVGSDENQELSGYSSSPTSVVTMEQLFAETDDFLKQLEAFELHGALPSPTQDTVAMPKITDAMNMVVEQSLPSTRSLLIYLQLILSTIRHVQRPSSKLVALQIIQRLARYILDEVRLQRIVPVLVSMLQDQDHLVRASAILNLTSVLARLDSFSPSDSKLFPQYIFKRVSHLITDPSAMVRIAFASSIGALAESALRFLDISHAVRLYEAVGSGTGQITPIKEASPKEELTMFADDVANLLDNSDATRPNDESKFGKVDGTSAAAASVLINSNYNEDLSSLHETVSRWVVHITTDQAADATPVKRALLSDIDRLCNFFGLEGVMSFILPQILAFLNDRIDWELRSTLFDALPCVCRVMGRAATEEFVIPCVEVGLIDMEELVVERSLVCLSRLIELNLLSRGMIIGNGKKSSFVERYGALLLHPSTRIRAAIIQTLSTAMKALGLLDSEILILPALRSYLRYRPSALEIVESNGLESCLRDHWTRELYWDALQRITVHLQHAISAKDGAWTTIDSDFKNHTGTFDRDSLSNVQHDVGEMTSYLQMLAKHSLYSGQREMRGCRTLSRLEAGIEGSLKQAQIIMFPRQDVRSKLDFLPTWYDALREASLNEHLQVSEATMIRTVSMLGHVYGLSIMGPATTVNIVGADDDARYKDSSQDLSALRSTSSKRVEALFRGQWGSETTIDPELCDTTLLITKLKALGVPPLPYNLGTAMESTSQPKRGPGKSIEANDWRPRMNSLVATSTRIHGHSAPIMRLAVASDNRFFVSGSHDGTCRVWETAQIEDSLGVLESSLVYSSHAVLKPSRVNDVAIIEGSHSAVSCDSNGAVHVWRVERELKGQGGKDKVKTTGTSTVRTLQKEEGEIFAVSHFNTLSESLITFATHSGRVHSWDLRSADEPFLLTHSAELGHLTSLVVGSDRNWIISGTSRGYVALWDVRFQKAVKLWRHSRRAPISRLGTSMSTPPQSWGSLSKPLREPRPSIFIASGENECSMFDAISGSCNECFRVVASGSGESVLHREPLPVLIDVSIAPLRYGCLSPRKLDFPSVHPGYFSSLDSIKALVGSIGGSGRHSYLVTGGSDSIIRCWDFAVPSKCYEISGQGRTRLPPSFERIDFDNEHRLMLCCQPQSTRETSSGSQGLRLPESVYTDSVEDLKIFEHRADSFLVSSGRDALIKIYH